MNFSETSSRGFQKDPITSIRAHISQKKREFDTLSNTNDGLLLQEAFARAASGSRSGERTVNTNLKSLCRTTDFSKKQEQLQKDSFTNKYLMKRRGENEYDLQNPLILESTQAVKDRGCQNELSQFVQIEKKTYKFPDSAGLRSNIEDNLSIETKSQFTDQFEQHPLVCRSRSSQNKLHFATENMDGKIAQHILRKQVTLMKDEEYQQANFQQNLSQLDQNSKEDKVSYGPPKIHIYEERVKPMDLDELNKTRISPQRPRTAYGYEQESLQSISRTKYIANLDTHQQSLFEDPNYVISVIKIPEESLLSTDLTDPSRAQVSVQSNQVLNIKTSKSADKYVQQPRLKAPSKQLPERKRLDCVRQLHCVSQQKTAKSPKQQQSTTLNVLSRKQTQNKGKLSKSETKTNKGLMKPRGITGLTLDTYKQHAPEIQNELVQKSHTPIVQYQSSASVKKGYRNDLVINSQSASKNNSYNSTAGKPSPVQRVQSLSSQKSRVRQRFNQLQSTQAGTPTETVGNPNRDSSRQMRGGSNTRGASIASGGKKHSYMQSTYAASVGQGVPSARNKVTPDSIQKDMVSAFSKVRLDLYQDVLRIKKPLAQAFTASQMLCKLVNAFRGGSQKTSSDRMFEDWQSIQDFIHRKPNVIKFNQEITQLIQHMILSQDYLRQLKSGQLKNHLNKLIKLQAQYFGLDSHHQVLKQFLNQKNFRNIVNIVYTTVRYVLFQAGRTDLIDMGDQAETEEENQIQRSTLSVKSGNTRYQRPASASINRQRAYPSLSNTQLGSGEKSGIRAQLMRRPYNATRKCGADTNSNVTPKSLHKQEHYDYMSKTQQIDKLSPDKHEQYSKPTPRKDKSGCETTGLYDPSEGQSQSAYSKLPPSQKASRPSSIKGEPKTQPKKLYEMMLEKQKKSLHNKYERLTMNSVGKRSQQALSLSKRNSTTPGSHAQNVSIGRDSSHESTNIIINQRGFDLKTPCKQGPSQHQEDGTPQQTSPLASPIKYTPLAGRYGIAQSPSPQKLESPQKPPQKEKDDLGSKNSRARKSRQERIKAAKADQCSFDNAIISAHQEMDAIQHSLCELQNDPSIFNEGHQQVLKTTSIMEIPGSACQLGSSKVSEQNSPERKYVPKASSYLMPLQIPSKESQRPVQVQAKAQGLVKISDQIGIESSHCPVMQTEESETCVIRQIQLQAPLPYDQKPSPIQPLPSIRVQMQASPEKFCETKRLPVNLGSSDSQSQGSYYDNKSQDENQEQRIPIESQRYTQRSPEIDFEAEAQRIACFIKFEVDQESQSVSPDKQSLSMSPVKEQTPLLQKTDYENKLVEQQDDLGQLSQRTDNLVAQNMLETIPCPESIHTRNATVIVENNNQNYQNYRFHEEDESIKTQREQIDKNEYFVKEMIILKSDRNPDLLEADNKTTDSKQLHTQTSIMQEIRCTKYKNPCDQSEQSPQKGKYDSIVYDRQSSESQGDSPVIVKGTGKLFEEDTEESPQPRELSPKRIMQKNDNNKTFKKIEEKEPTITSEEDNDSELCMKEIISPFREMRISSQQRNISPEERKQAIATAGWKINPIQVKREDMHNEEDHTPRVEYSVQEENQDDVYSSNGSQGSPCESPVRQPQYAAQALQKKLQQQSMLEYENHYVSKKETIISPGKLKQEVSNQRAYIMEQLDAIEQEIIDNSPSKNPVIDRALIAQLKQRRLNSRLEEKSVYDQKSQKEYQDSVISELQSSLFDINVKNN